jgi:hypothetical protein
MMKELAFRQIIIAEGMTIKIINFWFDAAQASIGFAKKAQKK